MKNETLSLKEVTALYRAGAYVDLADRLMTVAESTGTVRYAADAAAAFRKWEKKPVEHFLVAILDGAHKVLRVEVVSKGILNRSIVHPREVFAPAISARAAAIIVAHNHPSGQLVFSEDDKNITKRLASAGEILGIALLDHILLTPRGAYLSIQETCPECLAPDDRR